jgi:hypothetical protein
MPSALPTGRQAGLYVTTPHLALLVEAALHSGVFTTIYRGFSAVTNYWDSYWYGISIVHE